MGSKLRFFKVLSLPTVLAPDALYFVDKGLSADFYITGRDRIARPVSNPDADGSSSIVIFRQEIPSDTWEINHPIPHQPDVIVMDSGNTEMIAQIVHTPFRVTINFGKPFTGTAIVKQ